MNHIAIIPARSGSKGLKDKNIKLLNGKPMLSYTIEAALESQLFSEIHVSTDSDKYADIARNYGASVPFLRSEELASDNAGSWDVVKAVLKEYEKKGFSYDMLTLLQPTSPLRTAEDIVEAYSVYQEKKAAAVISVCEMEHSPKWSNVLPQDMSLDGFIDIENQMSRQRISTYYRLNGAIYMMKKSFLYENVNLYRKGAYAYVMSQMKSIDVDTQLDFDIAEFFLKKM